MGFVDDVELILKGGGAADTMQTLLFSATLPAWVKDITKRFLRKDHKMVDLVGTDKMKVGLTRASFAASCMQSCCKGRLGQIMQGIVLQGSACANLVRANEVQIGTLDGSQPILRRALPLWVWRNDAAWSAAFWSQMLLFGQARWGCGACWCLCKAATARMAQANCKDGTSLQHWIEPHCTQPCWTAFSAQPQLVLRVGVWVEGKGHASCQACFCRHQAPSMTRTPRPPFCRLPR